MPDELKSQVGGDSKSKASRNWYSGWRIGLLIATLPFLEFFVAGSLLSFRNEIAHWTSPQSSVRVDFDWFQQEFDTNDFLVVSWREFELNHADNGKIVKALNACPMVDVVTSGWEVYWLLRNDLDLDHDAAIGRLKRSLVSADGQTSGVFITLTQYAVHHRIEALSLIHI